MAYEVVTYEDAESSYRRSEIQRRTDEKIARGFQVADVYLNRSYLDSFALAPIIPPSQQILSTNGLRVIRIDKIVLDTEENYRDKLMSVYSALHSLDCAVVLVIQSDGNHITFHMGVRSDQNAALAGDILESTIKGNFPGVELESYDMRQIDAFASSFANGRAKSVAAVSVVPSARETEGDQRESFVQGIEKFIDTMTGKSYSLVCLATPIDRATHERRRYGYEELCSSMSPHQRTSIAFGQNESDAVTESISRGFSESVNRSVSNSNSRSESFSHGRSSSSSGGSSWGGSWGDGGGGGFNWGGSNGWSEGSFSSYTSGNSFTSSVTQGSGSSTSETGTKGKTRTTGTSSTITLNYENKSVTNLIERADRQIERMDRGRAFGMWEFCSYLMSADVHTTVLAANTYKALMVGEESDVETAHLNVWRVNQAKSIASIAGYLGHMTHPVAKLPALPGGYSEQEVTPTNLVSGDELPLVMGFPKKSVAGLPVIEMAEFGRSVVYERAFPKRSMEFGSIYHMGVTEDTRVPMDLDLLASHCFITGSSGSGKSYATYQLLEQAIQQGVKLTVIEPAKGEYKQVFGGVRGIKIYTTDPNAYRLLKINPFQFPKSIHVLSHIEQLMQIFNASWPLYAAMPAILKAAVVKSYVECGWDVQNSIWIPGICDHKYPLFSDVLKVLPPMIDASDYSAESKGNYKGALVTRVEAMTTGLNGLMFKESEGVPDEQLFDCHAVIDLSELGSDEAIALVMGVLIMKLGEHRKDQRKSGRGFTMDSSLHHITVLEEAHNLLKRTSKEQNQEGSNMVGKSVEMISNSIKEMRTYGEGFVIIDQSPMAVDTSAIENTATKIIMNTPARDACEELGSALSLDEDQTAELARLNVGVAAVFQKGWLSPVLMKVDRWDDRYATDVVTTAMADLRMLRGELAVEIVSQRNKGKFSPMSLRGIIRSSNVPGDKQRELTDIVSAHTQGLTGPAGTTRREIGFLLIDIMGCEQLFEVLPMDGVMTYREYEKIMRNERASQKATKAIRDGAKQWFERALDAFELYAHIPDVATREAVILDVLLAAGNNGDFRNAPQSRVALLCWMVHRSKKIEMG